MPREAVESRMLPEDRLGAVREMIVPERRGRHGLQDGFDALSLDFIFQKQGRAVTEAFQVISFFLGAVGGSGKNADRFIV
jgi:hypothetical protein